LAIFLMRWGRGGEKPVEVLFFLKTVPGGGGRGRGGGGRRRVVSF